MEGNFYVFAPTPLRFLYGLCIEICNDVAYITVTNVDWGNFRFEYIYAEITLRVAGVK